MPLYPPSKLDQHQIIQHAFDEANQRLRTDATLNISSSAIDVIVSHINDSIRLGNGTDFLTSSTVGPKIGLDVNVINNSSVIITDGTDTLAITPSGEALVRDNDANTALSAINSKLVDGSDIGDVTINNGAGASAVNIQDGGNSITVDAVSLDIRVLNHSSDSVAIGDGTELVAINASGEMSVTDGTTHTLLTSIDAGIPAGLGQTTMAASMPVAIVSNQSAIKIAGTSDGTNSGTEYGVVYNQRQQVLDSHDRLETYTYADFGTKNERITRIDYTSATFSGITVRRDFNYVLDSGSYRPTTSPWSIV